MQQGLSAGTAFGSQQLQLLEHGYPGRLGETRLAADTQEALAGDGLAAVDVEILF